MQIILHYASDRFKVHLEMENMHIFFHSRNVDDYSEQCIVLTALAIQFRNVR